MGGEFCPYCFRPVWIDRTSKRGAIAAAEHLGKCKAGKRYLLQHSADTETRRASDVLLHQ